jgi:hypothetical protein
MTTLEQLAGIDLDEVALSQLYRIFQSPQGLSACVAGVSTEILNWCESKEFTNWNIENELGEVNEFIIIKSILLMLKNVTHHQLDDIWFWTACHMIHGILLYGYDYVEEFAFSSLKEASEFVDAVYAFLIHFFTTLAPLLQYDTRIIKDIYTLDKYDVFQMRFAFATMILTSNGYHSSEVTEEELIEEFKAFTGECGLPAVFIDEDSNFAHYLHFPLTFEPVIYLSIRTVINWKGMECLAEILSTTKQMLTYRPTSLHVAFGQNVLMSWNSANELNAYYEGDLEKTEHTLCDWMISATHYLCEEGELPVDAFIRLLE